MNYNFSWWKNERPFEIVLSDIITGTKSIDTFSPSFHIINTLDANKNFNILDFGCGVGRNSVYMALHYPKWNITGYDNDFMVNHVRTLANLKYKKSLDDIPNLKLYTTWEDVLKFKYDLVICSLVLQHIGEQDLDVYLESFKTISNKFIILSRRALDELDDKNKQKNVWVILEKHGFKNPSMIESSNYSVYGDGEQHYTCVYNL